MDGTDKRNILLYVTLTALLVLITFGFAYLNQFGKTSAKSPNDVYEALVRKLNKQPKAFVYSKNIDDTYNVYIFDEKTERYILEIRTEPVDTDGLPITRTTHGTVHYEENGYRVDGIVNKLFQCPVPTWYWSNEEKRCKMKNLCSANESHHIKGIPYYHYQTINYQEQQNYEYHPRLYAVCKESDEAYDVFNCKSNEVYIGERIIPPLKLSNGNFVPNHEAACKMYDICTDMVNGKKHNLRIPGNTEDLKSNEYYECSNGTSLKNECPTSYVFHASMEHCVLYNRCIGKADNIKLKVDENSYIICENEQEHLIKCKYGIFTQPNTKYLQSAWFNNMYNVKDLNSDNDDLPRSTETDRDVDDGTDAAVTRPTSKVRRSVDIVEEKIARQESDDDHSPSTNGASAMLECCKVECVRPPTILYDINDICRYPIGISSCWRKNQREDMICENRKTRKLYIKVEQQKYPKYQGNVKTNLFSKSYNVPITYFDIKSARCKELLESDDAWLEFLIEPKMLFRVSPAYGLPDLQYDMKTKTLKPSGENNYAFMCGNIYDKNGLTSLNSKEYYAFFERTEEPIKLPKEAQTITGDMDGIHYAVSVLYSLNWYTNNNFLCVQTNYNTFTMYKEKKDAIDDIRQPETNTETAKADKQDITSRQRRKRNSANISNDRKKRNKRNTIDTFENIKDGNKAKDVLVETSSVNDNSHEILALTTNVKHGEKTTMDNGQQVIGSGSSKNERTAKDEGASIDRELVIESEHEKSIKEHFDEINIETADEPDSINLANDIFLNAKVYNKYKRFKCKFDNYIIQLENDRFVSVENAKLPSWKQMFSYNKSYFGQYHAIREKPGSFVLFIWTNAGVYEIWVNETLVNTKYCRLDDATGQFINTILPIYDVSDLLSAKDASTLYSTAIISTISCYGTDYKKPVPVWATHLVLNDLSFDSNTPSAAKDLKIISPNLAETDSLKILQRILVELKDVQWSG